MNNDRRFLSKGSTLLKGCWFWSKKLHFQKNFGRNFIAVEGVNENFQIFQFKGLLTWPILKFVGKDIQSNVNVGPFEGSHRITAVRHPWLISAGGLPETRGGFSAEC